MFDHLILVFFAAFTITLLLFVARMLARGIAIVATPPIHAAAFVAAKICAFSSCLFIPAGVINTGLRWYRLPAWTGLVAAVLFVAGLVVAVVAMKKLGDDLIFGLPGGGIRSLKTKGIFGISRNPLYLGFILIILSSMLLTPNPVNFAMGAAAIGLHHLIILKEEAYLIGTLGDEYRDYMKRTGRYLSVI